MYLLQLIRNGVGVLSSIYPETEAREIVLSYLEDVHGVRRHTHLMEPEYMIEGEMLDKALADLGRMASGEPLQYVTGKAYFYGRVFRVTPDTLIPRQETELLCREAISMLSGKKFPRILDLCTGSGCIAWTLALEIPGATVVAVDVSEGALNVASEQEFTQELLATGAKAPEFIKADILCRPQGFEGQFDMVVSNPPYVTNAEKSLMHKNVLDHEPHLALFVPDEDPLLFYRAVADWSSSLLKSDGGLIVEINEALGPQTSQVFFDAGLKNTEIIKDLSDKDRFIFATRF